MRFIIPAVTRPASVMGLIITDGADFFSEEQLDDISCPNRSGKDHSGQCFAPLGDMLFFLHRVLLPSFG